MIKIKREKFKQAGIPFDYELEDGTFLDKDEWNGEAYMTEDGGYQPVKKSDKIVGFEFTERSNDIHFKVYVTEKDFKGDPAPEYITYFITNHELEAIGEAKRLVKKSPGENVYIFFKRNSNDQTGFLNPSGFNPKAEDWTK